MKLKVPEVTIWFWVIKIMATTVGETAADFLIFNLHLGLTRTSIYLGVFFLAVLALQLAARRYIPWVYWLAVLAISVFGTLVTDNLVDNFGVSLVTTTVLFTIALIVTFAAWYWRERTLAIHTIYTTRRELFYWAAILFTFALGTAAGDLVSEQLRLGYLVGALVFAAIIGIVALAYYSFNLETVPAFWIAYVLTRPFGASCGDWLSQARSVGGLGLGTVGTSAVFLLVILGLVTWLEIAQRRSAPETDLP